MIGHGGGANDALRTAHGPAEGIMVERRDTTEAGQARRRAYAHAQAVAQIVAREQLRLAALRERRVADDEDRKVTR